MNFNSINEMKEKAVLFASSEEATKAKESAKTIISVVCALSLMVISKAWALLKSVIGPQIKEIASDGKDVCGEIKSSPQTKTFITLLLRVWRLVTYAQYVAAVAYLIGGNLPEALKTSVLTFVMIKTLSFFIKKIEGANNLPAVPAEEDDDK